METGRVFDTWATTECDECGVDFQVTRAASKTIYGRVWCSDCQQWEMAYNEGFKHGQESVKSNSPTDHRSVIDAGENYEIIAK